MNACVYVDSPVAEEQRFAPSRSQQTYRTRESYTLTPAQELVYIRNLEMLQAAYQAVLQADAEGAPIAFDALNAVDRLVAMLPSDMPSVAEAYVSESGCLNFDWDEDPENQLSIMMPDENSIAFAAYNEGDRLYGTVRFGARLPEAVATAVRNWIDRSKERERFAAP